MYSFLLVNGEHKKTKCLNRNIIRTISYNEYKGVLLNNKVLDSQSRGPVFKTTGWLQD